jgi:hypothetical protein
LAGGRRKLHSKDLHNLYTSPDIIRMIESRRIREARQVASMEKRKIFMLGSMMGKYRPEDLGVDGKIILKLILRK